MKHLKTDYEDAIKEINALTAENNKLEGIISQAEQYFSLSDKPDRSAADDLRLNISKQTVTAHGILTRADLDKLKKEKAEQEKKDEQIKKKNKPRL